MTDILDVEVMLSNFEGRTKVSLREFIGYASMILEETAFREGENIYQNVQPSGSDRGTDSAE